MLCQCQWAWGEPCDIFGPIFENSQLGGPPPVRTLATTLSAMLGMGGAMGWSTRQRPNYVPCQVNIN